MLEYDLLADILLPVPVPDESLSKLYWNDNSGYPPRPPVWAKKQYNLVIRFRNGLSETTDADFGIESFDWSLGVRKSSWDIIAYCYKRK